jgi:lysozyme
MQLSEAGLELLKSSEGFRGHVYLDGAGLPTIGFGHRLLHPESFPERIDEAQAEEILRADIREAEQVVRRLVKVSLTQGQFDALVDFVFNLGSGRLFSSTLLKILNAARYEEALDQLLRWDHMNGQECTALKARREAEAALWRGAAVRAVVAA